MHSTDQTSAEEEEQPQQIVPVYELLLSSDDSPSASLRVASVPDDQRVVIRCAIASESAHAFIPGTLTLHKNGKRVGTTADDGTVFTRRTVTVENSLNYNFVPWNRRTKQIGQSADDVIILGRESNEQKVNWQTQNQNGKGPMNQRGRHHRAKKHRTKSNSSSVFSSADHSVLFHCSALARPSETRRRGRVPGANLYQRTLKMTRSIGADEKGSLAPCPVGVGPWHCLNGGICVRRATGGHFCQCAEGFSGRNCERPTAPRGIGPNSPFVLCVSFLLLAFLLFVAVGFGLALIREKRRRRSRTVKATINRLDDIDENCGQTPFEQIYEAADYLRAQSPIPTIHSTMSNGQKAKKLICSESGGYDNLEKLQEEIRRQKAALEEIRRKGTEDTDLLGKSIGPRQLSSDNETPNWLSNSNGTAKHNETSKEFTGWTKC